MATSPQPDLGLARQVLPEPLFRALCHVFAQGFTQDAGGCILAGGTSLAGFYAGHRRSDDLDLFTSDESQQRSTALAVKSLASIGVAFTPQNETAQYFEGVGRLDGHFFKVTAVLDQNLFRVGAAVRLAGNVRVVDLETLFKMKAATLVSRCSEKDLYDLVWLFTHFPERTFADLIRWGGEIDGGVNGEALLSSVSGAILRKDACDFALDARITAGQIYDQISEFRRRLLKGVAQHLEEAPTLPLGALVHRLERLARK